MHIRASNSCCGVKEICELREHQTPEEAFDIFLDESFNSHNGKYIGGNIYLFDGVRKWTEGYVPDPEPTRAQYTHAGWTPEMTEQYYNNAIIQWKKVNRFGYAFKFAKFLKANDLGVIKACPLRQNTNYVGHLTEAYLWCPDVPKLTKLWNRKHNIPPINQAT